MVAPSNLASDDATVAGGKLGTIHKLLKDKEDTNLVVRVVELDKLQPYKRQQILQEPAFNIQLQQQSRSMVRICGAHFD